MSTVHFRNILVVHTHKEICIVDLKTSTDSEHTVGKTSGVLRTKSAEMILKKTPQEMFSVQQNGQDHLNPNVPVQRFESS
jgi:hypothetical protein